MIIQFECDDSKVVEVLEAIKSLGRNPRMFLPQKIPQLPSSAQEFETRAQAIAKTVEPRGNQAMRRETLELVLNGGDTWFDQNGEPDPALRNATGALSKALRRFDRWAESPLDILCERRRETYPDGAYKGQYRGTRYIPTKLGKRVREILQERGVLRKA